MVKLTTRQVPADTIEIPDGRARTVIEDVSPQIEGGRYPIKRVPGEVVTVEADVFADGHDASGCAVLFRRSESRTWQPRWQRTRTCGLPAATSPSYLWR